MGSYHPRNHVHVGGMCSMFNAYGWTIAATLKNCRSMPLDFQYYVKCSTRGEVLYCMHATRSSLLFYGMATKYP